MMMVISDNVDDKDAAADDDGDDDFYSIRCCRCWLYLAALLLRLNTQNHGEL